MPCFAPRGTSCIHEFKVFNSTWLLKSKLFTPSQTHGAAAVKHMHCIVVPFPKWQLNFALECITNCTTIFSKHGSLPVHNFNHLSLRLKLPLSNCRTFRSFVSAPHSYLDCVVTVMHRASITEAVVVVIYTLFFHQRLCGRSEKVQNVQLDNLEIFVTLPESPVGILPNFLRPPPPVPQFFFRCHCSSSLIVGNSFGAGSRSFSQQVYYLWK